MNKQMGNLQDCSKDSCYVEKEIRETVARLTKKLIEKKITITTMESATSGQIASLITDTEGASSVVKGACVTYSNEAKIMQGVPEKIIETYGVYSAETAKAMAMVCRKKYRSNIGIGVTGTLGNIDTENEDSVPGQVYFAIDIEGKVNVYERVLNAQPTRYEYKLIVAEEIVDALMGEL